MRIAVLVTLFVALLPEVLCISIAANETVDCYTDSACQSSSLTTTALECCTERNGDSFQVSGSAQCLRCLVFGFDQTHYALNGSGVSFSLGIQLMKFVSTSDRNALTLIVTPQNLDSGNFSQFQYFFSFPQQQFVFFTQATSASYEIVTGTGDDTALDPELQFQLLLDNLTPLSDVGVINLTPTVSVSIQDADVVAVHFSVAEFRAVEGNPPSAGGNLNANVNRDNKALARDLIVRVTASTITDTSSVSRDVAESEDFTAEEKTVVFPRTVGSGGEIPLALTAEFQVTADEVNEADEVFQLELSASDGVGTGIDFSTRPISLGVIENDDGISIGFVQRNQPAISVPEGSNLTLTLEAIAAFGATQTELARLPAAMLSSTNVQAVLNTDYTLNASTVQPFPVSQDGSIQSVTFTAINTLIDDVVEGDELFVVRAIGQENVYEITGSNGLVSVSITDQNSATIEFEMRSYTVMESAGYVEIAVISTGARYAPGTIVRFYVITSTDGLTVPATSDVDFNSITAFEVLFDVQGPTSSSSFEVGHFNLTINNDQVDENSEQVNLGLIQQLKNPTSLPVVVSSAEAVVTIVDDDQPPTVMFVQSSYTVTESSLEAQLQVQLTGQLDSSFTVNVLGQTETGIFTREVLFEANEPNQIKTVNVPVSNDDIALETNLQFGYQLLGISDLRVQLGRISTTTLIITDDDNVTVQFTRPSFVFFEDDGTVSVDIEITSSIAQQLTVFVSGGPGSNQPAGVDVSGTTVAQTITFVANGTLSQSVLFTLTDDNTSLEPDETYFLSLTNPNPVVAVGNPAMVTIIDNDNAAAIKFVESTYRFSEGDQMVQVEIELSSVLQSPLTIRVVGGPGNQPSSVVISGVAVNQTITFQGGQTIATLSFTLINDQIGLEDDESYQLILTNPSQSVDIGLEAITNIIIIDDEMVTVTFEQRNYSFAENVGSGIVRVVLSNQIARELQLRVSGGPGNVPATVENSGTDVNQTILFQARSSQLTANVVFAIIDDSVGLEDMQSYSLSIGAADGVTVTPHSSTVVTIIDDEVAEVMVSATSTTISESSGQVTVCAMYTGPSRIARDISVTFSTSAGTATDGQDYVGGQKQAVIRANSLINAGCVIYTINSDSVMEEDEYFDVVITAVMPSGSTTISQTQTTRVTITDTDTPTSVTTCSYFQATRVINTFNGATEYGFNAPCEHALLLSGDFGIFIDSLDGSVPNSRIGIRDGSASIVIDINGNVLSQMGQILGLTIASSDNQTFIEISTRGIVIIASATQISVQISDSSSLPSVLGLCGDLNGNLVLQNGVSINANNQAALEAFINEYFILPGETFVRQIVRRECGLLANDTESGDPTFMVPLDTGSGDTHEYSLCYEIFGAADQYFNFISDTCVSVNALYASVPENRVGNYRQNQHFVQQIAIRASGDSKACVNVEVTLGNDGLCSTTVDNGTLISLSHGQRYSSDGISVRAYSSHARITVPNCENVQLIMKATCKATQHGIHFIEFKVTRGLNLHPTSHGLIAQFWNIPASVTQYTGALKDGSVVANAYVVELRPPDKPIRRFLTFLYQYGWDFTRQNCLYAGDSNGGPSYEVEDPNDSVIEGIYTDYITSGQFNTTYIFSEFEESFACQDLS